MEFLPILNFAGNGNLESEYLVAISKIPVLSQEEVKELGRKSALGSKEAKDKLFYTHLRYVSQIALKYKAKNPTMSTMELIQEGNLGLLRAISDYNPEEGTLTTYATHWIKQRITRYIEDTKSTIREPVHVHHARNKYKKLIEKYKNNTEEIPSDEVICEILEITPDLLDAIRTPLADTISLNSFIDDEEKDELISFIPSFEDSYGDFIDKDSDRELLITLKESLPPIQYFVISLTTLAERKKSLEEVSNMINTTRERVRQIQNQAMKKIKLYLNNDKKILTEKCKKIKEKEGVYGFSNFKLEPIFPSNVTAYLYLKNDLSKTEQKVLKHLLLGKYDFKDEDAAEYLELPLKEYLDTKKYLLNVLKTLSSNRIYQNFKNSTIKTYSTKIFTLDLDSEIEIVDYDSISKECNNMLYNEFLEKYDDYLDDLTQKEIDLINEFFAPIPNSYKNQDVLERNINCCISGRKRSNTDLNKKELYKVYIAYIEEFTEEQQMFIESYIFGKIDKKDFKSKYPSTYLKRNNVLEFTRRLERLYFNINRFNESDFDKDKYIKTIKANKGKLSPERENLLNQFYGVGCEAKTISELAEIYNMDYVKMHTKVHKAIDAAKNLYIKRSYTITINKKLYASYITKDCYEFTPETRRVATLFLVDNKSYSEISEITGLNKTRISNIITDAIARIDLYRFNIIELLTIKSKDLENVYKYTKGEYTKDIKKIIYMKFIKHLENKDIAEILGLDLKFVNKKIANFKKIYLKYQVKDVELSNEEINREIFAHPSESVLNDNDKILLSYYLGLKNQFNPNGEKLSCDELIVKLNVSKNIFYHHYQEAIYIIKLKKAGLKRADLAYMERSEIEKALNDVHIPIPEQDKKILSHLYALNGYEYKNLAEVSELFQIKDTYIRQIVQRSIVLINKYNNKEIEGQINFEVDLVPILKYFTKGDRLFIEEIYKNKLSNPEIAKKYNLSPFVVQTTFERLTFTIYNILNDKNAKKFDFEYYENISDDRTIPFYGDITLAKSIFELYYGVNSLQRMSVAEIIKTLNLDMQSSSVNKYISEFMLSICKHQIGIRKQADFTHEDIVEYYNSHKDEMTYFHKTFYLNYFTKYQKRKRKVSNIYISDVIIYDLLTYKGYKTIKLSECSKEEIIHILRSTFIKINKGDRKNLMALFQISPRELMKGKDINHVYRIINSLEKKTLSQGKSIELKIIQED